MAEAAIAACDMAEVIGSAIALNLLFNLPIVAGVFITSADVLIVLLAQGRHFRFLEGLIGSFILLIGACFVYELAYCDVDVPAMFLGLLPRKVSRTTAIEQALRVLSTPPCRCFPSPPRPLSRPPCALARPPAPC